MKRLYSISVIALAVISLQISTIVPHCHHGNTVCIVSGYDEHECDEECPSDCPLNHGHEETDKTLDNDCITKASFVVSEQNGIKHRIHFNGGHNFDSVPVLLYLNSIYDAEVKLVYLTKHRYREKAFPCKSADANRINGLRAPPYSIA
ncbi:MAG: hypothetical protein LBK58_15225 [Prevotellaceae bacterium]|nr:hypothetical protein [Prevotellaceae bacterium]